MEINSMSVVVGAIDYIEAERRERQDMCAWEQGCIFKWRGRVREGSTEE